MTRTMERWARRNLFASPFDCVLSVLIVGFGLWLTINLVSWAIWSAHWAAVRDSIRVLLTGTYPADETWRIWLTLGLFGLVGGLCVARQFRRFAIPAWLAAGAGSIIALGQPGLDRWGGLMLSIMLTLVVSAATLPLGILLAFGRRSRSPSLRICCTAYIEVMRSVPLILVVYWIWISVPLLMPQTSVSALARGMAGYTVFYAAYVAEYVRSGLQAVPLGQVEAARSLGMSGRTVAAEIVLPQAIKVVLPALVGNILDIFNGATLVFIIGLTDFLRAGQMILADPTASGQTNEVYLFMFVVYFGIGSSITFGARRIEARLHRSTRP
jgi:general L-amino acid transport system permease protein